MEHGLQLVGCQEGIGAVGAEGDQRARQQGQPGDHGRPADAAAPLQRPPSQKAGPVGQHHVGQHHVGQRPVGQYHVAGPGRDGAEADGLVGQVPPGPVVPGVDGVGEAGVRPALAGEGEGRGERPDRCPLHLLGGGLGAHLDHERRAVAPRLFELVGALAGAPAALPLQGWLLAGRHHDAAAQTGGPSHLANGTVIQ